MAERVERFAITIAPETALQDDALTFPIGQVIGFTIEIPHGHHRLTGIAIFYGDSQVIPAHGTSYYRGNGTQRHWDLDDPFPGGTGWFSRSFNNDHHYSHQFHCEVELDIVDTAQLQLPPVILLPFIGEPASQTAQTVVLGGAGGVEVA